MSATVSSSSSVCPVVSTSKAGDPHDVEHLDLVDDLVAVAVHDDPGQQRPDEVTGIHDEPGLLPQLAHRGLEVALAGVDAAARGDPPVEHRVEPEVGVEEEQHPVGLVEHEHPHRATVVPGPVLRGGDDEAGLAGKGQGSGVAGVGIATR